MPESPAYPPASWQKLNALLDRYGDAFYLLDTSVFRANCRRFLDAFCGGYPRTRLGYSYKTNYIPALCKTADGNSSYAEVVSEMEYGLALRLGIDPANILCNGPLKSRTWIEDALVRGARVNLDSWTEVGTVKDVAAAHGDRRFKIGLRCAFDIGTDLQSRFGFDADARDLAEAFCAVSAIPNCAVAGLHCHFSCARPASYFTRRAKRMLGIAADLFTDGPPDSIDLGGGFCGIMRPELAEQFDYDVPTFEEYAQAITPEFRAAYPVGESGPELILEPGIGVLSNTMQFVTRVKEVKALGGRSFAVVAGSVHNVKPIPNRFRLPVTVLSSPEPTGSRRAEAPCDIVGYTCMEIDVLHAGYTENLGTGDIVVFDDMGAYTNVLTPPFIRPAPPILQRSDADAEPVVVRRAETSDDVFQTYTLPEIHR